jgi:hypothetical protein
LLPDQFKQTMGVLGLTDDPFLPDRMFRIFDANQDGKLSFFEFASSLATMIRGTEDEKLKLSFEMTAGQRGAIGIRFEDFEKLIHACGTMMESLVTPDIRPVDNDHIRRMFGDISSDRDGESVITIDDYKAAAQSHEDFLVCLGVLAPSAALRSGRRQRTEMFDRRKMTSPLNSMNTFASGGQELVTLPVSQIDEMRERVTILRDAILADKFSVEVGNTLSSSSTAPALAPQPEDPDERWWTPLPRQSSSSDNRSSSQKRPKVVVDEEPRTADGVMMEFNRVINWCSNAAKSHKNSSNSLGSSDGRHDSALNSREGNLAKAWKVTLSTSSTTSRDFRDNLEASPRQPGPHTTWLGEPSGKDGQNGFDYDGLSPNASPCAMDSRRRRDHSLRDVSERSTTPATLGSNTSHQTINDVSRWKSHKPLSNPKSGRRKRHRLLGPKKGLAVHFGHENWNMVLSMMIGIRMSVGRIKHEMSRELTPVDFIMKEKFSIIPRLANIFDSEVSKRVTMTRFYDYAPMVFQRIRTTFGIHHDDYLRSVGPEQLLGNMVLGNLSSLSELSSEGKSGAFFYYTADGKYMMKTVTPKEQQLLKRMLKKYYDHIMKNTGTLIVRFLGLHCLTVRKTHSRAGRLIHSDRRLHFVVMGNMFNTPFDIHCRYDLKGSYVGRVTHGRDSLDPSIALKDVDFTQDNQRIRVGKELKEKLVKQIESDSAFLRDNNVIDYSLLLGIHNLGASKKSDDEEELEEDKAVQCKDTPTNLQHGQGAVNTTLAQTISAAMPMSPLSIGTSEAQAQSHWALQQYDLGGLLSHDGRQRYFFGIIDILTPYDTRKRVEHHAKALRYDRRGVSCCPYLH